MKVLNSISIPAARHIANKHNIDINTVPGSGKGGRVTKGDIINFMSENTAISGSKALSTPAVRHFAKENNIDINTVPATGKGGRVSKEDIVNFMSGKTVSTPV